MKKEWANPEISEIEIRLGAYSGADVLLEDFGEGGAS